MPESQRATAVLRTAAKVPEDLKGGSFIVGLIRCF
jgi:hypothetical protein